eukprot:TRINITY_DN21974_c0_g1_i1.p1 TRINITY_DN21974_c0_g1~~TRINITY_DN21974_c0_g1_i1.p1  ORF type:complete len:313 (+),score=60.43 TRINITY_DN21974_c0_g1_i1:100-1038(+)
MIVQILFLLLSASVQSKKASDVNQRECPLGYVYVGEDSTNNKILTEVGTQRNVFYEEVSRSDVYSCYKIITQKDSINYFEASKACSDEVNDVHNKARLISFDDGFNELQRFVWKTYDVSKPQTLKILTSGLKLPNYDTFIWSSTNSIYNISESYIPINGKNDPDRPCLLLRVFSSYNFTFETVSCKDPSTKTYACEVRVQMVTFYKWFVTNSWNLILIFTIVILGIALCMSGFAFKSSSPRRQNRIIANHVTHSPKPADLPPSYETYVNAQRVHEGLPPKYDSQGEQISRVNHLMNKGKEILTSVTVLKARH